MRVYREKCVCIWQARLRVEKKAKIDRIIIMLPRNWIQVFKPPGRYPRNVRPGPAVQGSAIMFHFIVHWSSVGQANTCRVGFHRIQYGWFS